VLLTGDVTVEAATAVARRVLAALEEPFVVDGLPLHTGASIGVALHPDHAAGAADLQSRADIAMYQAKRSGRGVAVYEPGLDGAGVRRIALLADLREAIAGGAIQVRFRPWFDLTSGRVATVEAVACWEHPEQGPVETADLLALAELAGLGGSLFRHVVTTAFEALAGAGERVPLAVHVAARQLTDPATVAWLERTVVQHHLAPGDLVLQVPGAALVDQVEPGALDAVRGIGVHVALDGFGGRSVLAHLRRHRVDVLKVDPMFGDGVATDQAGAAIYGAVVALAGLLGARVVAQGAASDEDLATLARLGCHMVVDERRAAVPIGETGDAAQPLRLTRSPSAPTGRRARRPRAAR
jgi:predicted signal transduction protein with EAL and GGDEF domain